MRKGDFFFPISWYVKIDVGQDYSSKQQWRQMVSTQGFFLAPTTVLIITIKLRNQRAVIKYFRSICISNKVCLWLSVKIVTTAANRRMLTAGFYFLIFLLIKLLCLILLSKNKKRICVSETEIRQTIHDLEISIHSKYFFHISFCASSVVAQIWQLSN